VTHGDPPTASRKADHIRINLEHEVQSKGVTTGFERYRFVHDAMPDMSLASVETGSVFLGRELAAPVLISCMTGGVPEARVVNERLAAAAQALGCAMGVGSQRAAIETPSLARYYQVRRVAPDVPLLANLGAVQLNYGYGLDECRRAVEMIDADALVLHLNPLQEAVQPEGDTDFSGLLPKIADVCARLGVPVIVKEVGWGISGRLARRLVEAGVSGIDVAGAGGTSWTEVERHRLPEGYRRRVAASFSGWGIPTAESVQQCRQAAPETLLIASGGLRTGIDAATAIALGADVAGFAGPLLRAAAESEDACYEALRALIEELSVTMYCTGSRTLADLRSAELTREGE